MELWHNMKDNNIFIIGMPKEEESEQVIENLLKEIMAEK